jgi:hypothetical protein
MRLVVDTCGLETSDALYDLAAGANEEHRNRFYAVLTGFGNHMTQELAPLCVEGHVYQPKLWLDEWEEANKKPNGRKAKYQSVSIC